MEERDKSSWLNFEVLREPWNRYRLIDGTILAVKHVLAEVIKRAMPEGKFSLGIGVQQIIGFSHIPNRLLGTPSTEKYSPEEIRSSIVEDDMRYDTLSEEWNEYVAEDGTRIRLKVTLTRVSRTNKFDKDGKPIYQVETTSMAEIKPPKI